jgi:hypothetical protein
MNTRLHLRDGNLQLFARKSGCDKMVTDVLNYQIVVKKEIFGFRFATFLKGGR